MRLTFTKDILQGSRFTVGDYTYGKVNVVGKIGTINIGKYCSLADGTRFITVGHNPRRISTYPFTMEQAVPYHIEVGNDVWVGQNVIITGNTTIGDGAVIGAGSVVAKDIPPYSVAVGVPAEVKKLRFPKEQVAYLLKLCWWNWPRKRIEENAEFLMSEDTSVLCMIAL